MIVIASSNLSKLTEFKRIMPGVDFVLAKDIGIIEDIEETGTSFLENAQIKAEAVHKQTKYPVIADDSGLEIFCLGNFPGIFSARFAAPIKDYKIKCDLLLKEMEGRNDRKACFTCAMVLLMPDGTKYSILEHQYGTIADKYVGDNGFGYDPIFIGDGSKKTNAELSDSEKDLTSHRGKALRGLFAKLPQKFIRREVHD